jgi:hypothetical protein
MGSLAALQGCGGDDDDGGDGSSTGGEAGDGSGGTATGGRAGSSTGGTSTGGRAGSSTGGTATGGRAGSSTGGAGGAPGGMGGEDTGGGAGGASGGDREAACTDYCDVYYQAGCDAFDGGYYGTEENCVTTCTGAIWDTGEPGAGSGNSVHCRLTHAGYANDAASAEETETHCGHARATPMGVCVGP